MSDTMVAKTARWLASRRWRPAISSEDVVASVLKAGAEWRNACLTRDRDALDAALATEWVIQGQSARSGKAEALAGFADGPRDERITLANERVHVLTPTFAIDTTDKEAIIIPTNGAAPVTMRSKVMAAKSWMPSSDAAGVGKARIRRRRGERLRPKLLAENGIR